MKIIDTIKSWFVKPATRGLVYKNAGKVIEAAPNACILVVGLRRVDCIEFDNYLVGTKRIVSLEAYRMTELRNVLPCLESGTRPLIMLKHLATQGWKVKPKTSVHIICLNKVNKDDAVQLLGRFTTDDRYLWNVDELTVMSRLQENAGVFYDEMPNTMKFNPHKFDKFLKTVLYVNQPKFRGM